MLFNSYGFLFLFLPVTLLVYFLIVRQGIHEAVQLLARHAPRMRGKTVLVGLDFPFSSALHAGAHSTTQSILSRPHARNAVQLVLSWRTFLDSLYTLGHQNEVTYFDQRGAKEFARKQMPRPGGQRKIFIASERGFARAFVSKGFSLESPIGTQRALSELRSLFRLAYANDIKLHGFISPSHARQSEINAESGLWSHFEEWKRNLARLNEEEAALADKPPYPLWDFSGYDAINTEEVPDHGDTSTAMRWYWESSHYRDSLGELIVRRMLFEPDRVSPESGGIGSLLATEGIEWHLASIRAARERYRSTHPADVAEIAQIVRDARRRRARQGS